MVPNIDRIFTVAPAKLSYVRYRRIVQRPERVLVEGFDALFKSNFNTVRQKIILPKQVVLLDFRVKRWIVFFSDGHGVKCWEVGPP